MNTDFHSEAERYPLRIPEVFWKIIYDDENQEALVFIVFNSPCPWDTPLLNALNDRNIKNTCSRIYCSKIINKSGLQPYDDEFGLLFCCETVKAASQIFQSDAEYKGNVNEIRFLPEEVQQAEPLLPYSLN